MPAAADFIARYDPARDRARVAFAWNGKHADDFRDANQEFRRQVVRAALRDVSRVPVELVRDLYDAETAWAKEAWGVDHRAVSTFARELLTRGGAAFVEDYLAGKVGRGMDASMSAHFECPRQLAQQLLAEVVARLAAGAEGERLRLLEAGRDIFRQWVEDARE
jgi:hypothetical protein